MLWVWAYGFYKQANYKFVSVKTLLSQNVSPNETNEDGLTALHQVCQIIYFLLQVTIKGKNFLI